MVSKLRSLVTGSVGELRKVVWPTAGATLHTTLAVGVFVTVLVAFVWSVDSAFENLLRALLSHLTT